MDEIIFNEENNNLIETLDIVKNRLENTEKSENRLNSTFSESNTEYLDYLKVNANKINEEDVVELVNMQTRLDDLESDSESITRDKLAYNKMLDKPYFARIDLHSDDMIDTEKYYIGLHSLVDDDKNYRVLDWRSPISSIYYDYENGKCQIKTNSSILSSELLLKRQFGISNGHLDYYIDSSINIEDQLLQEVLAKNTTNQMKSIVQTIQREQNKIIRGDENITLVVNGVAGSGKTAIALHRIAYLLYKLRDKIDSKNIVFLSPNKAFSTYISSVLPDLAENDIEKLQLDIWARAQLKKHLILERKYEQIERLLLSNDTSDYDYKISVEYLKDLKAYACANYIDNFDIQELTIHDVKVDVKKVKDLFFGRYADRDLFTRFRWITDNIFDTYFYSVKSAEKRLKLKQLIFTKLYDAVENKNCVKAYMNFLKTKGMSIKLVGSKVRNEDAYGILFFKLFIYGLDKFKNIEHLVIDEMQDYSPIQMYILDRVFDCPKTILGDYNQTLSPNTAYGNSRHLDEFLSGDILSIDIHKSYRQTVEISDFANYIGNKSNIDVIDRHGEDVRIIKSTDKLSTIVELVKENEEKGYKSIAIITKTNASAKTLYMDLKPRMDKVNLVDDDTDEYNNDICVISAYNSKGLEFDAVIIVDVDNINYENEIDRNVLYIATTRPLHNLVVLYDGKVSSFVEKYKGEN